MALEFRVYVRRGAFEYLNITEDAHRLTFDPANHEFLGVELKAEAATYEGDKEAVVSVIVGVDYHYGYDQLEQCFTAVEWTRQEAAAQNQSP